MQWKGIAGGIFVDRVNVFGYSDAWGSKVICLNTCVRPFLTANRIEPFPPFEEIKNGIVNNPIFAQ